MTDIIIGKGHNPVGELIQKLSGLLGRYATRQYADVRANRHGVLVEYNTVRRNMVAFSGVTHDKIGWRVEYDLNQTRREYIDNMVMSLRDHIAARRKDRQQSAIIIPSKPRPIAVAVDGTIQ